MQAADLLELRDDLSRECSRLQTLVSGLSDLGQRLDDSADAVDAAALRLHSFYTGVEQMLLLVSRVVNGGTPAQGEGWQRRLLERMAMATDTRPAVLNEATQVELQEYLRFRHLVRNLYLYADELRAEPIQRLIEQLQHTWPKLDADITGFQCWLTSIARETRANTPQRSDDTISQVDEALPQRPSGSRHRADLVSTTAQENQATSSDRC